MEKVVICLDYYSSPFFFSKKKKKTKDSYHFCNFQYHKKLKKNRFLILRIQNSTKLTTYLTLVCLTRVHARECPMVALHIYYLMVRDMSHVVASLILISIFLVSDARRTDKT